jgi:hypothetical protein
LNPPPPRRALPPLPFEDADDTRHGPPPLPQSAEARSLDPESISRAESAESVSAAINDPFGPLTDLSLQLPEEPEAELPPEPRPSLLDRIELPPAEPHPARAANEGVMEPPRGGAAGSSNRCRRSRSHGAHCIEPVPPAAGRTCRV